MIGWGKAVALLLGLFSKIADAWQARHLRKAGRDEARSEYQGEALDNVRRANAARLDTGVLQDPDNRDLR